MSCTIKQCKDFKRDLSSLVSLGKHTQFHCEHFDNDNGCSTPMLSTPWDEKTTDQVIVPPSTPLFKKIINNMGLLKNYIMLKGQSLDLSIVYMGYLAFHKDIVNLDLINEIT